MSHSHITQEQKEIMLEFVRARPQLYAGKFSPQFTRVTARGLWQELANILNTHPNGAKKEWCGWRKTWIDIKKNSKAKVASRRKYQMGTGGGPPAPEPINSFETKVMELASPICVAGNVEVPAPTIVLDEEIIFNETTEVTIDPREPAENIELDHDQDKTVAANPTPNIKKKAPPKKITKAMRLKESIKNHAKMVEISERGINETREYRLQKLQILREQRDEIKKQTLVMENISTTLNNIEDIIREFV